MSLSAEKFNQGMNSQQYLDQVKVNKEAITAVFKAAEVPPEDKAFFDGLDEPLKLAVFTAAWCGDALSTTPVIMRLGDASDKLEMRIFDRDEELELTNSFLPPHRAGTVPVFVVLDSQMQEIGRFVETAKELVPSLDHMEEAVAKETMQPGEIGQPMNEISEASRNAFRGKRTAYRVDHASEWGKVITNAFTKVVKEGLALPPSQRPAKGGTEWPPPEN